MNINIYIYIYIYIYIDIHFELTFTIPCRKLSQVGIDSNARSRAYRAHAITTDHVLNDL